MKLNSQNFETVQIKKKNKKIKKETNKKFVC